MQQRDRKAETIIRVGFEKALTDQPRGRYPVTMKAGWIEVPLGSLLAVGNDDHLYMLAFVDVASMERRVALIQKRLRATLEMGDCATIDSIRTELADYFAARRREFSTPLRITGTAFQVNVYEETLRIPYGNAVTYATIAERIGKPAAFRAVAQAIAQTPLHIVIPCHRVINSDGGMGGYAAGMERKQWLLDFEKRTVIKEGL